jgi:hypothetical protein
LSTRSDKERDLIIEITKILCQFEGFTVSEENIGLSILVIDMGGTPANVRLGRMINTALKIVQLINKKYS